MERGLGRGLKQGKSMDNNTMKWLGFGLIVFLIIAIFENRRKKAAQIKQSTQTTETNVATGNVQGTVGGATNNVTPDANYDPTKDASDIWYAGCWKVFGVCTTGGNETTVTTVISRLNKAQLAKLKDFFAKTYSTSLDNYFADHFWDAEVAKIRQAILRVQ